MPLLSHSRPAQDPDRYSWVETALLIATTTVAVILVSVISVLLRLT